ncbi:hypothetical protein RhiirB3_456183 [Rhizophagus irregularis]|nr:hypothetical protein RhiirB3_456183 [Rhizophagus irregularis]
MTLCRCRIWIEDSNGHRIAGDKKYHDFAGSFKKKKARGPFNENTCFSIHGTVNKWGFDQKSC